MPRGREGRFSTELFERYQRSEKTLVSALAEMYVQGVSTRKIKAITEELLRMLAAPILGELVEHRLGVVDPGTCVVALPARGDVPPQARRHAAAPELLGAKLQRGVVAEHHEGAQDVPVQRHAQPPEQLAGGQHPVAQRLARQPRTVTREHALLARQWQGVAVLADENVRKQPRAGVRSRVTVRPSPFYRIVVAGITNDLRPQS